ncbi:hypothetical protein BGZ49_004449 [Haplosporangium sp. Z 27]|nr:hypothetical protein BGZ49_004449 [Haplosporangium sp. Z 27]
MTDINQSVKPQSFRTVYKDETTGSFVPLKDQINIHPRHDVKSGKHFILWNDVKAAVQNPLHIRHGNTAVPFLADDRFEFIHPLRIATYPGTTLDVVVDPPKGINAAMESLSVQVSPISTSSSAASPVLLSPEAINLPSSVGFYEAPKNSVRFDRELASHHDRRGSIANNASSTPEPEEPYTALDPNDSNESFRLGLKYYEGKGVPRDYKKAMDLLLLAANQGHASAQEKLGHMYQYSQGVKQDLPRAVSWYQKAASQGNTVAEFNLGYMYENGHGIKRDYFRAVELYQLAADKGYARAQCNQGVMYENGRGVSQDYVRAAHWYQKAAMQGLDIAQCNLGFMYEHGRGVIRDYPLAVKYYQLAADQGYAAAQCNLGNMYRLGHGVTQDIPKAMEWFQKAADQGSTTAESRLKLLKQKRHSVS